MANGTNGTDNQVLVVGDIGGVTVIDRSTPLRRLNYFDGKFLRASDFALEQDYLRQLVGLSNQGLGWGVVYGYDTTLGTGDSIQVGPGLAIDPSGKVLLMQATVIQSIQALIDASKKTPPAAPDASGKTGPGTFSDCITVAAPPPTTVVAVSDLYVIAICAAEALCGQADVYGKLCEEACVTSTDRPFRLDGIVLKAIPLQLLTPLPTSKTVAIDSDLYLRSKVAHSFYLDEVAKHPSAISRDGLLSKTWCLGAGYDTSCCEVPLAVVARAGATTVFLDAWIVRRERIDAPPRRYWQWKMMMRPWNVFLAQVLQFQCQLGEILSGFSAKRPSETFTSQQQALADAVKFLEDVRAGLSAAAPGAAAEATLTRPLPAGITFTRIADLRSRFEGVLSARAAAAALPTDRILIRGGIIEVPPAGYLPIVNGTGATTVNAQVRALFGEGLDLRFCIVTADYVAHAFEQAEHMDRISLLQGIDDPNNKPRVDILVPDGKATTGDISPDARLYDAAGTYSMGDTGGLVFEGAAREELLPATGTALYVGGAGLGQGVVGKYAELLQPIAAGTKSFAELRLTPDLETSDFIRQNPKVPADFASRLRSEAAMARARPFAKAETGGVRKGAIAPPPPPPPPAPPPEVDALWLTGRVEKRIKDLPIFAQTPISLRLIVAIAATGQLMPAAMDTAFTGTLTVTDVVPESSNTPLKVIATLNLVATMTKVISQPAREEEREVVVIARFNYDALFSYDGDDLNGTVTMDVFDPSNPDPNNPTRPILRFKKTYLSSPSVEYEAFSTSNDATNQTVFHRTADLVLTGDSDVIKLDNHFHQTADDGLDIVQAALLESEPTFKKTAESELFPALAPATVELTIQAVRDWVLFTKRREEVCATEVVPVTPPSPRTYRVFNMTVEGAQEGKSLAVSADQSPCESGGAHRPAQSVDSCGYGQSESAYREIRRWVANCAIRPYRGRAGLEELQSWRHDICRCGRRRWRRRQDPAAKADSNLRR
jgi:hypothetical protein